MSEKKERQAVIWGLVVVTALMSIWLDLYIGPTAVLAPVISAVLIGWFFWTQPVKMWFTQKLFFAALAEVIGTMILLYVIAPFLL